jgi:rubrerythrin
MAISCNAEEVLQIAVDIERNGQAFYRKAAEVVEGDKPRALLIKLAEWEAGHQVLFEGLHSGLAGSSDAFLFDPEDEATLYLQAIADGLVFNSKADAAELLGTVTEPVEILNRALAREKDAVIFFAAMREALIDKDHRQQVNQIVKEEMSHVRFLVEMLKELE